MTVTTRPWHNSTSNASPSEVLPEVRTPPALSRWWPQQLHHQLALMVSLALVLALSVLGGYTAREQADEALKSHQSKASALARQVAISARNPMLTNSLDQLEELVLRSADSPDVQAMQVLMPDGRSLTHARHQGDQMQVIYGKPGLHLPIPAAAKPQMTQEHNPDRLVVWHPIVTNLLVGWVRLEYDTRELKSLQWRIWRNTLVVAALAVSLCGLVLAWMMRKPMQALHRAQAFAKEITQADGRQLPIEPGPIEVMELTRSLNEASMLVRQQLLIIEDWLKEHQLHEARLAERNAQLSAIFSLSRDGLLTLDQERRVLFANQIFLDRTGLKPDEIVGQDLDQLNAKLQAMAQAGSRFQHLRDVFAPADADGRTAPEQTLVLGTGLQRSVLQLSGQLSEHDAVGGVIYLNDVTRQHTLDQMKSEFLSMAAHELRTPMVSIFGFTELMLKREMKPEQRQDLLGRIYRHGQSMIAILNELLDLARIESRRGQDFHFEEVDFAQVVQGVLNDFKPPNGRDVPVVEAIPGLMPVRADLHKLQQAVLNILSNAYKYSPDGGNVEVRFHVRTDDAGRTRHGVTIADHGMGLSPEDLARLGERFFRVDKSGNIPGTGLGVSIVKELMELMGGRMAVASTLGEGTQVTLWL